MKLQVFPIDPQTYERHEIHARERQWAETNCYVDVWIELLHAWGYDPVAALPFTVGIDFEGDQWTFFKFPLADFHRLYGLDVQELMIWRPMVQQLQEQVQLGRPVLVEMDSYYLPDTAGTSYRSGHVKSTIAVTAIDPIEQRLGYFHGQGYYELSGEDYARILHLDGVPHPAVLPPYVEFVKRRNVQPPTGAALTRASLERLADVLHKVPETNPFDKFRPRFEADLDWLINEPLETFHQYSFATLRQFGACYELTATYLRWLLEREVNGLDSFIKMYEELSTGAKTMQFQLARTLARKRRLDLTPIENMAATWRKATEGLKARFLAAY